MKRMLSIFILCFLSIHEVFAGIEIASLLPNPVGDDTLGEYIEVRNPGCTSLDISNYSLTDASGKTFLIPLGTHVDAKNNMKFPYSETKISLNNSGEETIFLKDSSGELIDSVTYSGSQKDDATLEVAYMDEICEEIYDGTGVLTESGVLTSSGEDISLPFGTGNLIFETGSQSLDNYSGTIHSLSGMESQNGMNLSESGILNYGTGDILPETETGVTHDSTGVTLDTSLTGSSEASSGIISPLWLYYDDSDKDGIIDTLIIEYGIELTGSVNTDYISIYSRTGGLYTERVNTLTGYVLSGSLSGSQLILKIRQGDTKKTMLEINNTTTSDLRLKSTGELGFYSGDGENVASFTLTASFGNYKNVGSNEKLTVEVSNTGTLSVETIPNVTESGSFINSGELFPKIIPFLQSPTNAIYNTGGFLCTKEDCHINITLEPLFQSGFSQKNFRCYFGTGESLLIEDQDCNPNTYNFRDKGRIIIELHHIKTNIRIREDILVEYSFVDQSLQKEGTVTPSIDTDTGNPVAVIDIDSKWKEYYEQIGDYEMNCYAFTCSLNFTAEESYDPEGSTLRFLWIYGLHSIKTTKDPGALSYGIGDHRLILRVIDGAGNYDEIVYITHVLGPKPKMPSQKSEKISIKKPLKQVSSNGNIVKKKYKKIMMEFFAPPELYLQGTTGKKGTDGKYQCSIKTAKTCSMNFTITGALSTFDYKWSLDGREVYRGKNPKAWKLLPGNHTLTLETFRKNGNTALSVQVYEIKVLKVAIKGKPKTKQTPSKKTSLKIIPRASAMNGPTDTKEGDSILAIFILFSGLGFGFLLRGRKKGNHSS